MAQPVTTPAATTMERRLAIRDPAAARFDLVEAFEIGWAVLHRDVAMSMTARLVALLADLRAADTATDDGLRALRQELLRQHAAGTPWRARDALDVVATLDTPAWFALLGLLDECPHVPEALPAIVERRTGAVSATAFAFVDASRTLATIDAFVDRLPGLLVQ